jgi:hypothetical protein
MSKQLWKVRISDGYCNYEYELEATNPNVAIYDVYQLVRKKLKAEECEAKLIPNINACNTDYNE